MTLLNCKKKKKITCTHLVPHLGCLLLLDFIHSIWSLQFSIGPTDFFLLFQVLAKRLSKPELEKWAAVSWGIWNACNKFYFEKIQAHPKAILDRAVVFLHEYQNLVAAQRNSWYTVSGPATACSGVLLFFSSALGSCWIFALDSCCLQRVGCCFLILHWFPSRHWV